MHDLLALGRGLLAERAIGALLRAPANPGEPPSSTPPMRSISFSHDMPKNSEQPTANSASSSSVAPLKPTGARGRAADDVAERAAGACGSARRQLVEAQRLERGARQQHEREAEDAERQRMVVARSGWPMRR